MDTSIRYVAIIPARSGSKGLPRKNIRVICGKPLLAWSVEAARASSRVERVIVSTDSEEIARVARQYGAETPFLRPAELADDTASTEAVLLHALDEIERSGPPPTTVVLLQPTSPFRYAGVVDRAITQLERSDADSLVSVCEGHHFFWKDPTHPNPLYDHRNRPRRQDIPTHERIYAENGSIYLTRSAQLRLRRNRLAGRIEMFVMSQEESLEIDSLAEFTAVEALMKAFGVAR